MSCEHFFCTFGCQKFPEVYEREREMKKEQKLIEKEGEMENRSFPKIPKKLKFETDIKKEKR